MLHYFANLWKNERPSHGDAIRETLQSKPEVRPFPAAVTQLLAAVQNPEATAMTFASIIECDAALSTRLLRIANSPLYGFRNEVRSIAHASSVVGSRGLRVLALSAAAAAMFSQGEAANEHRKRVWKSSLAAGVVARKLAPMYAKIDADEAFLACVFHDVGRVFLFDHFPTEYSTLCEQSRGDDLIEHEKLEFGWTHSEIGLVSARSWSLSENVQAAIGFHHAPEDAPCHSEFVTLISLANKLSEIWGVGQTAVAEPEYSASILARDEFDEASLCQLQTESHQSYADTLAASM